ncbi:MAG TPA: hypothetical protein VG714_09045 [Acidobacteriaceae bacterium]|nr:hypothetical protein [Acidobacteriaceae bacterium]
MKKVLKKKSSVKAETIARMADEGKNVAHFFTNSGRMMPPIQRVNVDFAAPMLEELDRQARNLNISRQAVIKTLLRTALDLRYTAESNTAATKLKRDRVAG